MNGLGLKENLSNWFSFTVPSSQVPSNYIRDILERDMSGKVTDTSKVIWLGGEPISKDERKGHVVLDFARNTGQAFIKLSHDQAEWFLDLYNRLIVLDQDLMTYKDFRFSYEERVGDFELFIHSPTYRKFRKEGLLIL